MDLSSSVAAGLNALTYGKNGRFSELEFTFIEVNAMLSRALATSPHGLRVGTAVFGMTLQTRPSPRTEASDDRSRQDRSWIRPISA